MHYKSMIRRCAITPVFQCIVQLPDILRQVQFELDYLFLIPLTASSQPISLVQVVKLIYLIVFLPYPLSPRSTVGGRPPCLCTPAFPHRSEIFLLDCLNDSPVQVHPSDSMYSSAQRLSTCCALCETESNSFARHTETFHLKCLSGIRAMRGAHSWNCCSHSHC